MDESLTEDEFYSGPLRGVFARLQSPKLLEWVHTLVLDGLSVPADLVGEILREDKYAVRVLSLRECLHLNQTKLQHTLRYLCRPTRAEGTPRLRALYVFGSKASNRGMITKSDRGKAAESGWVTAILGPQIGGELSVQSDRPRSDGVGEDEMRWYRCRGQVFWERPDFQWPETLVVCKNLIAFDGVLCRGPRHDIAKTDSAHFLRPALATVALGPLGCVICRSCPETPAIFGQSDESAYPLLSPPPKHASTVRAAQQPQQRSSPLILRCEDCLRGRWCECCNRWWCEACYEEPVSQDHLSTELSGSRKVRFDLCVENCSFVGE